MTVLDARSARRRYLVLTALRWLPVGLLIPIFVLVPLSRGLTLTEIGLVFAVQGIVVLALELPTGGLSDSLGRRPVLLLAGVVAVVSMSIFTVADTTAMFIVAMALQGIYRALDSGPLEAWYVDATLEADPDAEIEHGLSRGSAVLSAAIALGALLSGALVALHPIPGLDPLTVPLLVALALHVVHLGAVALLMTEVPRARNLRAVAASVRAVPAVIAEGIQLLRSSRVLLGIVLVEAFWGFSMVTFESLFPIRLSELVGGVDSAAAIMGPVGSAAWFASAAGAAGVVWVSRRIGVARSASLLRIVQGLTIVAMGVLAGPVGVVAAYLGCYVAHGASNPMHTTLLHRQVEGSHRTTVLSMNSMVSQPAGSLGAITLSALADGAGVSTAMIVGGIICAIAAPLYVPAWRQERAKRALAADPGSVAA
ncbi:MAG TPA: MFS transporter [Candidatus Limnocylindrales bacterium]|nr:MFS transporter [Candidatus Limnocylindrales bacterium]